MSQCGCKDKGWRSWWPTWDNTWGWIDYLIHPPEMVPCPCSRGDYWIKVCKDYTTMHPISRQTIEDRRGQAVRHEQHRESVQPKQAEIAAMSKALRFTIPVRDTTPAQIVTNPPLPATIQAEAVSDSLPAYSAEF